jgi:hypothetical protein
MHMIYDITIIYTTPCKRTCTTFSHMITTIIIIIITITITIYERV